MNARNWQNGLVLVALVALGVVTRLVPYYTGLETWNITATGAAALFAGFYFADLRVAVLVPLLTMMIADLRIGGYDAPMMVANYGAIMIAVLLGAVVRKTRWPLTVMPATIVSSTAFFAVSNFAVWLCWYPRTWEGLATCYAKALPFFRGTLMGDLLFTGALFGAYAILTGLARVSAAKPQAAV